MMKEKVKSFDSTISHNQEQLLENKSPKDNSNLSFAETENLIQQLEIHKIDLEICKNELNNKEKVTESLSDIKLDESSKSVYFSLNPKGEIVALNNDLASILEIEKRDIIGKSFFQYLSEDSKLNFENFLKVVFNSKLKANSIVSLQTKNSFVYLKIRGLYSSIDNQCKVSGIDITELKLSDTFREITANILKILNEPGEIYDSLRTTLKILKEEIGYEAVGIRLQKGQDFPYFIENGFSNEFLKAENTLFELDQSGKLIKDNEGNPKLVCTCGMVISGKINGKNSTPNGSWWTNNSAHLKSFQSDDAKYMSRNHCIYQAYNSIALVPIRNNAIVIGLIQFNSLQKNRFNRACIGHLEIIASHIGAALLRQQVEDELHKSEELLRSITENAPDIIVKLDQKGTILYMSRVLPGYKKEDVLGKNFREWSLPKYHPEMMRKLGVVFNDNITQHFETKGQGVDAEIRTYRSSISPLTEDGKVKFAIMIASDITESLKSEEIIAEKIKQHRVVVETTMDGFWLVNKDCKLIDVNDEYCHMSGYSRDELLKMTVGDLDVLESEEMILTRMMKIREIGEDRFETTHRRKNGEIFYVELSIQYQKLNGGQYVTFLHDITARKKAEVKLRQSEERYKSLFNNNQSVMLLIDPDSGEITDANPAACKYYGWSISELCSKNIAEINVLSKTDISNELQSAREEKRNHFFFKHKLASDEIRDVEVFSGPLKFGEKTLLYSLIHDITERKNKEKALQKLNQTLSALSKSSLAMLKCVDEAEYLKKICQIVVEDTDFVMANIVYAENDNPNTFRIMSSTGFEDNYFDSIKISSDDTTLANGPTRNAIITGEVIIHNNIILDSSFSPWKEQVAETELASLAVFPLKNGDKVFGAFSVYSKVVNAFLDNEITLLSELANDLAYGITTFRLREAHKLAEERLAKSHSQLEKTVKKRTHELEISNTLLTNEINIRKEQEHYLKIAEEKYRTVADFAANWEFWIDADNAMLYCSPSCERITGYSVSEYIKNSNLIFDIIHPDDLELYLKHLTSESKQHTCDHEIQFRIKHKDGTFRWIGHFCQPVYNEQGEFKGTRGSNKDITLRKKIEELLKASNNKFQLLSENISDGIFILKDGCFDYSNKAICHILGYNNEELDNAQLVKFTLPEYHDELIELINYKPKSNVTKQIEVVCLKKDLTKIDVEILFSYVSDKGVIYGVIQDITEKKQLQKNILKAIIQTEENEKAHFSKELHDGLGPLLSTIKLYLQWSERPNRNKSRDEIIKSAMTILEEALTTVREISNKLSPHLLTNYGLTSAIKNFVQKLKETSHINIVFESNFEKRISMEIESAIYRAVIECINNTLKHALANNIYIKLTDSTKQLHLQYQDDGVGYDIDNTILKHTGLGLFNLQNRIQTIGGKLTMNSKIGFGVDYLFVIDI